MTEASDFESFDAPRREPVPLLGRQHCCICGCALTVHEAMRGGSCSDPVCQHKRIVRDAQASLRAKAALRERAATVLDELALRRGLDGSATRAIAVVPSNERPLVPQSSSRVRAFANHLDTKVAEAFDDDEDGSLAARDSIYPDPELTEDQLQMLGQACGTCLGQCCQQGQEHAFVRRETILRYLDQHPDATPAEIKKDYLSRLPDVSYEDACIYQTAGGCVLPREMRSSTCNHFICRALTDFLVDLEGKKARTGFAIAADEKGEFLRSDFIDLPNEEGLSD